MPVIIIVLHSLVSEGTPHMALDLCRVWRAQGIVPVLLVLDDRNDELRPEFAALGIDIVSAGLRGTGYRRFVQLATTTRRLVLRTGARGVVSMLFGWHAFIALGAWSAGARTIAHVGNHPGGLAPATHRKIRLLIWIGAPFTRRLLCCSAYVRDAVVTRFGIARGSTEVVYNGVDLTAFGGHPRTAGGDRLVVTMVARLEGHKDQATLIAAVALLRDQGVKIELRLVGDGTRRAPLERLTADLGVGEAVRFLGFRSDIGAILADAHVFAFSTTPDEGLGIALIEAMVAELPIVASDVGACRETLDDGRCGLLVAPHDPAALAAAILAVRNDPDAAARRVAAARAQAFDQFDARAMAARYLAEVTA